MATNCCGPGEPTCEELYELSEAEACEYAECMEGTSSQAALTAFFAPHWSTNKGQFGRQLVQYMVKRELCDEVRGNNAERVCGPNCGEDCSGCTWHETGCDDPEQCDTYTHGWNYVALARAAEHAVSLPYLPYAAELFEGKTVEELINEPEAVVYVFDKDQLAANQPCDPCADQVIGAYVPVPASALLGAMTEHWVLFTMGQEGTSAIPPPEVSIFAMSNILGDLDVLDAVVSCAVGPDTDETWRIYDVDTDVTLATFTVTGNGATPLGTGTIDPNFDFAQGARYAVEPTVLPATPAKGVSLSITARYVEAA